MHRATIISLFGLTSLSFISGLILSSSSVSAEDVVISNVNVSVPVSCAITGNGNTSHSAIVNNGTYREDIGTTTLAVFCNDASGFAIYAAGYTGEEVGGTDSTKLIGITSDLKISTGTYTQGSTVNSIWAMKLTKVTDTSEAYNPNNLTIENGFGSYSAVPNAYTKVASFSSTTDLTLGSKLETTYAAYVSNDQRADTYAGKVKYVIVHPGSIAGNMLYIMQDVAKWKDTLSAGQEVRAMDTRDGKFYTVAKLADGNVWMTQNLDLDLDSNTTYTNKDTDIGYNTTTGQYDTATWTPIRSTYETAQSQTHAWCQGGTRDQDGYCASNDTPESYDPGDLYWNSTLSDWSGWDTYYGTCDFSTSTPSCSGTNPIGTYTSSTGTTELHLGNYYNWTAAVAMNDSSSHTTPNELIEQSICPAGWTLPRVHDGDDTFGALWYDYNMGDRTNGSFIDANNNGSYDNGETALWTQPLYFPAGGGFNGVLGFIGYGGYFWSPVVGNEITAMYAVSNVDGYANPSYDDYRYYGDSIRCVARPVATTIFIYIPDS